MSHFPTTTQLVRKSLDFTFGILSDCKGWAVTAKSGCLGDKEKCKVLEVPKAASEEWEGGKQDPCHGEASKGEKWETAFAVAPETLLPGVRLRWRAKAFGMGEKSEGSAVRGDAATC